MVSRQTGAKLVYLECQPDGSYRDEDMEALVTEKTKIAAMPQISNVLGRRNPVEKLTKLVHEKGGVIVIDAAQSAPHIPVDVQALDAFPCIFRSQADGTDGNRRPVRKRDPSGCDAAVPDGRRDDRFGQPGIRSLCRTAAQIRSRYRQWRRCGGLQAAIDYLMNVGFDEVRKREELLTTRAMTAMQQIPGVHIQGSDKPEEHNGIISFTVDGVHPHDIASILDAANVNVRAGHHCAQPLLKHLGVFATARASFAFYNTEEDIDRFVQNLKEIRRKMGYGE